MTARTLDGQALAKAMREEIRPEVAAFTAQHGRPPGLGIVLVGDNPASEVYVRNKLKAGAEIGFRADLERLPASATVSDTIALVERLNRSDLHDGILVQSPPPEHIDEAAIVRALDPRKDVDGFHPENVAKLVLGDGSGFVPCTPLGVQRLLLESNIEIGGAHVVVLGRSMIVGKPLALLLMQKNKNGNATVTVVHSRSRNLAQITRSADIVVAAIGRAEFLKADHIREGAIVIDVGINRVEDAASERGYRLVGDVAFDEVSKRAMAVTPVPGGVGPMTIAMLMANTVKAARQWATPT